MHAQLQQRLQQLEQEYQKGQQKLQQLDQERQKLYETMLRIAGAMQVLREELEKEEPALSTDIDAAELVKETNGQPQ